jgi:NADP-dependent 3-hydroxy acid dehydrogenase YdfG
MPDTPAINRGPLVFITGASSGIGQALAARFAHAGFRLALVARRTADMQTWADAQGLGPERCRIYGADVADVDSIVAVGHACLAEQGVPDVVIANAGVSIGMDTAEPDDIHVKARTFAINNTGLAATFHPFVTAMTARGSGALVGIASVAAIRGLPGTAPIAPARRRWWPIAKACAVNCAAAAWRWSPCCQAMWTRR